MRTANVVRISIAGISAMLAIAAHGQMDTARSSNGQKAEAVEDAAGNLHVPDAYLTTYQSLGTWAVSADQGKGSKELHLVYASPGTIAAYSRDGHFTDGTVLVKEVYEAATEPMTTGTVIVGNSIRLASGVELGDALG